MVDEHSSAHGGKSKGIIGEVSEDGQEEALTDTFHKCYDISFFNVYIYLYCEIKGKI